MRDDLVRRRRSPRRQVLGRVSVADQSYVVPTGERAVQRRADALICLRTNKENPPDFQSRQDVLEGGVLERVGVGLMDDRLRRRGSKLRNDLPAVRIAR